MKTHANFIPFFSGFYNSIHGHAVDLVLGISEDDFSEDAEKRYYAMTSEDWREEYARYAEAYFTAFMETEHGNALSKDWWTIEFDRLRSPTYYNYQTDEIWVRASHETKDWEDLDAFFETLPNDIDETIAENLE